MAGEGPGRLEKILTTVVAVLIVVAIGIGGLIVYLGRQRAAQAATAPTALASGGFVHPTPLGQPTGPAGPGGAPGVQGPSERAALPIPADQIGGPYMPWPRSFPKMLPGLFMLDDKAPELKLTKEQAQKLLPYIDAMGRHWRTVHTVEIKVKQQLTQPQRYWLNQVKHQVEVSTVIERSMKAAGTLTPGENASVKVAMLICEKYFPKPVPPELAKKAQAERKRVLPPKDYEQAPGEEWLTVFDETTAMLVMDEEKPELRLTPEQAVMIHAILKDVVEPLRVVSLNEVKVRDVLTEAQMKFVQDHMDELYKYRTGDVKTKRGGSLAFPGNNDIKDDTYHDPLYFQTVLFLKDRIAGR